MEPKDKSILTNNTCAFESWPCRKNKSGMIKMAKKNNKGGRRRQKIPILATSGIIIGIKNMIDAYKEGGVFRVMVSLTG